MLVGASKSISGFDPRSIVGCSLWLDAADASTVTGTTTVTAWNDKSGRGYSLVPGSGTTSYANNAITVNTSYLYATGAVDLTTFTFFIVAKNNNTNTNQPVFAARPNTSPSYNSTDGFSWYMDYQTQTRFYGGYPTAGQSITTTGLTTSTARLFSVTGTSAGVFQQWNNGTIGGTATYTTRTSTAQGFSVGGEWVGSSYTTYSSSNSIYEILVFNTVLSTTQRQSVEGYLAWKWGLQVQGITTPLSFSTCVLWLDAADSSTVTGTTTVTAWRDKSTKAYTLAPGSGTTSYASSAITLSTSYLLATGAVDLTTFTFFVVVKNNNTNTNIPLFAARPNTTPSYNSTDGFGFYLDGQTQTRFYGGYPTAGQSITTTGLTTSTATLISVTGTSAGVFQQWNNGIVGGTATYTTRTSTAQGFSVGGEWVGSSYTTYSSSSSIYEVVVYNSVLSTSQRQSVENYLSKKWSITITSGLPAIHPFYSVPAFSRPFQPTDIPGCALWMDAADNSTMNSTTTVTTWNDKSGLSNTMTGTATWSGSNMTFNGSTQAFSNTAYVFPSNAYSMFAVYSNTTAPAAAAYMNVVYGNGGYPMLGTFDTTKAVTARSVVGNTLGLGQTATVTNGWAAQIAATYNDIGYGVATDSSGNVFVTGYYGEALTLYNTGGTTGATLAFTGGYDCFLAKYSSAGSVLWATRITGTTTSTDQGRAVATDSSGNVFVTGNYQAALTLYNTGGTTGATLAFTGGNDVFLAKYSSAGSVVWAAQITGTTTSYDVGQGVATDSSGNVFVTGYYGAALTLYNTGGTTGATLAFTGGYDGFLAKYSSAGSVLWATRIASTGNDFVLGVATDSSGNVFVTGNYQEALTLYNTGGGTGATLAFTGGLDCFLAKYSSAGSVVWAAQIAGTTFSGDSGRAVATDSSGNVFVTGYYSAALTLYNTGGGTGATLAFTGGADAFLAKYSSAGSVVWAAQIAGTATDIGYGVATDSSGNVFVTGYYGEALTLYNTGGTTGATLAFTGGSDVFLAKYSSAGSVLWATRITGTTTSDDIGYAVATDSSGNVFVTGYYSAACTLYNTGGGTGATLTQTGGADVFLAKYSSTGFITTTTTYSGGYPATSNILVDGTYTPSTFSPYVNGSNVTALSGTLAAATGLFIGGPSNYFNGSLSELLIYSQTLTTTQRQQIEGYLATKWGLLSSVVSGHPFKSIPPSTSQPPQFQEVTPGNWKYDWQPYLQRLAAANSSGLTITTSNITGGATFTNNGWIGGVLAPNGNIYFTPFFANNILVLNPTTGVTSNLTGGATYISAGWAKGLLAPNGNIYFAPNAASNILVLNPTTGVTSNLTGGANYAGGYAGGVLAPNGNIYFPPVGAANILVLNPTTGVTSNITGGATFTSNGWNGGILAPNGNIYFCPYVAQNILVLNPTTGVTSNITGGANYTGWSGSGGWTGATLAPNGNIYFTPYGATNILVLNPTTGVTSNITGGATYGGAYVGGVLAPNGNIYFTPNVAQNILVLNPTTGVTSNLTGGATFPASGASWYGGVLALDGNIYFTPQQAPNILKINFAGLSQLPSSNYCLSAWTNKF